MNSKPRIIPVSPRSSVIHTDGAVYAVSTGYNQCDTFRIFSNASGSWEARPLFVGGETIVPFGVNNSLPEAIRDIMDENNLAPGILEREMGLLYGEGPMLYRIEITESGMVRRWISDPDAESWLKSFDFRRFVNMAMTEYKYMGGVFVKRTLSKGRRIGRGRVASLEVVPNTFARLEWAESMRLEDVKHIFTGDFENNCFYTGLKKYPVYDPADPLRHPVAMSYHNSYSFARSFYSVPSYFGALRWIMRSSDIPEIIKYLTDNGIAVAYHVHSPAGYWEEKRAWLEKMYPDKTEKFYADKEEELKNQIFSAMADVLAGKKNVGKFIETVDFHDPESGSIVSWKIEPIDQKIKDFIDAQLKIAEKADSATTSGLGLHPSLSNIIVGGQLSSGSQMLYALKLYLASDVAIPEEVIFEAVNQALEVNFPGRGLKMGFFHSVVKTEEDTAPDDRVKNIK